MCERQRDASRTGAHIHQLGTLDSARQLQHSFDQMLGLGTRNQHRRRDYEIQAPEFLVPGDVLRWHAGRTLGEHFFVSRRFFRSEFALGMRVQVGTIGAEDKHQQHLGVHAGRAHVSCVEMFDCGRERLLSVARDQAVTSISCFIFSAWKCVISASIMGWMRPSMNSGNWCAVKPMR